MKGRIMSSIKLIGRIVICFLVLFILLSPNKTKAADWTKIISDGQINGTSGNLGIVDIKYSGGITYITSIYGEELNIRVFKFDGTNWTNITGEGFENITTIGELGSTDIMTIYNGLPCFGGMLELGAAVLCYSGASNVWNQINLAGFGSGDMYVRKLVVFNNALYASSASILGARVWKYGGSGTNWTQINLNNFGQEVSEGEIMFFWLSYMAEYNGSLYAASYHQSGTKLWKYSGSGTNWSAIDVTGVGNNPNSLVFDMVPFKGYLYVTSINLYEGASDVSELWRFDGTNWERELSCGNVDTCQDVFWDMTNYKDVYLYLGTVNFEGGGISARVLRSEDGKDWTNADIFNFGTDTAGIISLGIMGDNSYILAGTYSPNGAELWMKEIVVPIITLPATGRETGGEKFIIIILILMGVSTAFHISKKLRTRKTVI